MLISILEFVFVFLTVEDVIPIVEVLMVSKFHIEVWQTGWMIGDLIDVFWWSSGWD
jgi:hypothetical protein